jgi:two-component system, cell cycle sensor histidine kinase and response regulator CckA
MKSPDETILIVDDESVVRRAVTRLLTRLGYEVLQAADGAEAVATFEANRERIAITVLDMVMPRETGDVTFHRIRTLDPNARILLASGHTTNETVEALILDGAVGFVQKPYRISHLNELIRQALDGKIPA